MFAYLKINKIKIIKFQIVLLIYIFTQYSIAIDTQNKQNLYGENKINEDNIKEYSIINDLRLAFEPFSTTDSSYHEFLIETNMKDYFSNYKNFLETIDKCCKFDNIGLVINSFDIDYQKLNQEKLKNIIYSNKINDKKNIYKETHNNKTIRQNKVINIAMLSPKCTKRKFNIKKEIKLNNKEILYAIAKECNFSIQYQQNKNVQTDIDNINLINIENKKLDFIIPILLYDNFYKIESNKLIIKDIDMKMFDINYISSTRMAQSNTDVLFSQEQQDAYNNFNSYINYPNYNLNYKNRNITQNQNISGYLDNLSLKNQLRSQMNSTNSNFGKSGTKIYSIDEINFWADIESKLFIMLDSKHGDKFMIDKGAGLIFVWTTKTKMKEVEKFLKQLEEKINLQVELDVEILSLTHFKTNNIGIDWQSIFSILNPSNSKLNVSFSNASLTIGNDISDLNSIINLLKTYGDLKSLSNPKIMVLNNQPAIISVGSVLRYTQNLVYQSNNTNTTIQNTSTQYPSIFAGILLDITPSINKDSIVLRINPSITKTKDPELENTSQALSSPPNLSTNQLSSIVKLKNGQRVIIGGLINNTTQNISQVIPKVGEIKVFGKVFGKESNTQRTEELIIIITPRIIY